MTTLAALLLATILGPRLTEARAHAAEGRTAQAIEAYQAVIAERKGPLAGDDEVAALTAVNELAELLIATDRAAEALALYQNLSPPEDREARLAVDYGTAVAAVAVERWSVALVKSRDVVRADPLYASAARVLAGAMARAPAEEAAENLVEAVDLLGRGGLLGEARAVLVAALRNEHACGAAGRSPLARALAAYATHAEVRAPAELASGSCEPAAQVARALAALFSGDPRRLSPALERLKADATPGQIERLLKHSSEHAIRSGQPQFALAAALALMQTGRSERSPIEAAYLLSQNPAADPRGETAAEIAHAARFLYGEEAAAVHLHLGNAAAGRGDTAAATRQWLAADELYRNARTPAPMLKVSLARVSTRPAGEVREYYIAAARDCTLLQNRRCTEKVLGEAFARDLIDAATAAAFGVTPETLRRNAPKPGEPGFGPKPRSNVSTPFAPSEGVAVRLEKWEGSASFGSALPIGSGHPRLDAAPPATPVRHMENYTLSGRGPLVDEVLWGSVSIYRDATRTAIAGMANDATTSGQQVGMNWLPRDRLRIHAAVDRASTDETGAGAAPSRAPEATIIRDGDTNFAVAGSDYSEERLGITLRVTRQRASWADEPAPGAGSISVFGADGIHRGAVALLRDRSQIDSLWLSGAFWPTRHLRLDAGSKLQRIEQERWRRLSADNAEAIAREVGGTRRVDVLRLARSSPTEVTRDLDSAWAAIAFDDESRFKGYVGMRFQQDRGRSVSSGAVANPLVPSCLPVLPAAQSDPLSFRAVLPRVSFAFNPWDAGVYYGRFASELRAEAVSFTNPAAWALFDLGYSDNNRNGVPDGEELLHLIPIAAYGTAQNTRGRAGPEIRDELVVYANRRAGNATYRGEITMARVTHIAGTRPLIQDADGTIRPAVRDDYVADRTIDTADGPVTTYRLRFAPTGAWELAEDDRRRDLRAASLSWRYWLRGWRLNATAKAEQHRWSIGPAFRERNDPTPLAAGRDPWGFERGNIDGMAASGAYSGADPRSLTIPNSRWSLQFAAGGSPYVPLIQSLDVTAVLTVAEGDAVSPYVSVFGADGIQRNVAVTRAAERLPVTRVLDLLVVKRLYFQRAEMTFDLSCLSCLGEETAVRRINQQNHPRAGSIEETTRRRVLMARLSVQLGR